MFIFKTLCNIRGEVVVGRYELYLALLLLLCFMPVTVCDDVSGINS
jgi:hypothetical protein